MTATIEEPAEPRPIAVLVVDDDGIDRLVVRRALRSRVNGLAFTVHEAASAGAARQILSAGLLISCVLLDLTLPDEDGLDLLRDILATPRSPPVLILTGSQDQVPALEATRLGVREVLIKGTFSFEALRCAIESATAPARGAGRGRSGAG